MYLRMLCGGWMAVEHRLAGLPPSMLLRMLASGILFR